MPATTVPTVLADGTLKMTAVDHKAQEDARRLQWSGTALAKFALIAATPIDVTRESNGDVQLQLTLRRDAAVSAPLTVGVGCGAGCAAKVDLQSTLAAIPAGKWVSVGVPLKCFAAGGADLSKLQRAAELESAAVADISVSRIALGAAGEAEVNVDCATR